MQQNQLEFLLWGYFNKTLDEAQRLELFSLIRKEEHQQQVEQFIQQLLEQQQIYPERLNEDTSSDILAAIQQLKKTDIHLKRHGINIRFYRWMYAAAAAVIAIAATIAILYRTRQPVQQQVQQVNFDIPDTRYGAVLTLPHGTKIVFDKPGKDTSFSNNGIGINMRRGILYLSMLESSDKNDGGQYTVTTPRGRQAGIVMPDGTQVWLNAASAISFPGFYNNRRRTALIVGEAFFEVSPGAATPFAVKTSKGMEVHILGTSFNINAYENEPAHTATLMNGKIKLVTPEQNIMMNPGEQAILKDGSKHGLSLLKGIDTAEVLVWKRGLLNVRGMTIQALGKQIERWYNVSVEVNAQSSLQEIRFGGLLSQDTPLSDLIAALESFGVHIKRYNNRLLISASEPV